MIIDIDCFSRVFGLKQNILNSIFDEAEVTGARTILLEFSCNKYQMIRINLRKIVDSTLLVLENIVFIGIQPKSPLSRYYSLLEYSMINKITFEKKEDQINMILYLTDILIDDIRNKCYYTMMLKRIISEIIRWNKINESCNMVLSKYDFQLDN